MFTNIFCPIASIFLDFEYDWYFIFSFFSSNISMKKCLVRSYKKFYGHLIVFFFLMRKFELTKHKISIISEIKKNKRIRTINRRFNAIVSQLKISLF